MIAHTLKNPLLHRQEVTFEMESSGAPSMVKAAEAVAEAVKSPVEQVVVKSVRGGYGDNHFMVEAFVYSDVKEKDRIERKPKAKKGAAA